MFILLYSSLLGVVLAASIGKTNEPFSLTPALAIHLLTPNLTVGDLIELKPELRQRMLQQQIPEEDVNEYFEHGFIDPPYDKARRQSLLQWAKKWGMNNISLDAHNSVQSKVTSRVSEVFRHVFIYSAKLASLATADSVSEIDMEDLIVNFRGLSQLEQRLFERVDMQMPRKKSERAVRKLSPIFILGFGIPLEYDWEISKGLESSFISTSVSVSPEINVFQLVLEQQHSDMRKNMGADGVDDEGGAVQEFIENGLFNPPYNKEKFESIKQWARRWHLQDREIADKVDIRSVQSKLALGMLSVFNRLDAACLKFDEFAKDDKITAEEIDKLSAFGKTFSTFEQVLLRSVSREIKEEMERDEEDDE
ncbi:hypothetical protein PFISCL1PPCAC_7029 [Pristionchus fissidentatus]|uniref:Uncharacterized protein n=1 Tax=Pristionchus fissidentatus TaxID=1538716 RepID=A0AAV5VC07_9BILA|nr:hypothetical protein PFISCL1PPCAC_7029 [Pristionchus fissidentatus]